MGVAVGPVGAAAWDDGPRRNPLTPWVALLVLLVAAIAAGWLLTRRPSGKPRPASGSSR